MADRMLESLEKLLDDYDGRRRDDVEREQKTRDDEANFLERFAALRRDVIRPVFESAAAVLEARGHRCNITEQESASGSAGRISEAGISIRIVPAGHKATLHEDQRSLSITTRHYNKSIWINSGESNTSGGIAGAKGAHALEKVDRQRVEEELLAFVARVVAA